MRKIRLSFVIIVFLSFINVVKALDDSDNALIEQNILYAMEQVNDNMSDHDKAMFFGVYTQLGNDYGAAKYDQSYYSVFLEHNSVCAGFNDAFRLLNQTAGLSCERVSSNMGDHAWNICNLDNEWTYFDATAGTGNHPNRIDFTVKFKSRDDFPKQLASMFNFSDVRLDSNNFFKNSSSFPNGVTSQNDYSIYSQTYYTDTYKYYIDSEYKPGWASTLYKENINSGSKEKIADALYDNFNSGLVKDGNLLYYVGNDKNLYTYNITNNAINKIKSSTSSATINGVYTIDGIIYYVTLDSNNKATSNKLGNLNDWSKLGYYDVTNENYRLRYIESNKHIVILGAEGKNGEIPSGNLVLPDKINNKPVIGIGIEAFRNSSFSGELKLPSQLEYIGNNAFAYSKSFDTTLKLPTTLKSIGRSAFTYVPIKGDLVIPDNVTYIGSSAFDEINISSLKLSNNLKYISSGTFSWNRNLTGVLTIPSSVEYIGASAFSQSNQLNAVIIPSNVKEIGDNAFNNSKNLEEIIIESENIDYMNFGDLTSTVYLHENTKTASYAENNNIEYQDLVSKVTFSDKEINGNVNDVIDLKYTLTPKYYYPEKLIWDSTDKSVATVDNGKIKLLSKGQTTISVKTVTGNTTTINVNVTDIYLKLNYSIYQFNSLNETLRLEATLNNGSKVNDVTWSVDNNEVISINNGLVTPKRGGLVYATATSKKYGSTSCYIYVSVPVTLSDGSKQYVGDLNKDGQFDLADSSEILNLFKYGANKDQILIGDLDNDGGITTADSAVIMSLYKYRYFTPGAYKEIKSVTLNKNNITLNIGGNDTLIATINPTDTTDSPKLTWKSDNVNVARVDGKGEITGIGNGTCTITVTTSNGKSAEATVKVGTGITPYLKGDLNENGKIEVIDAVEALYYALGKRELTNHKIEIGDFNNDQRITAIDAVDILRLYMK